MTKLFWLILIASFAMGIYSCWPAPKQPGQVNIPLYRMEVYQQELVDRGHTLRVDGMGGKITDAALIIEAGRNE
jgi:hypothetical protein